MKREYTLINQEPCCCLGACLQMILNRHNMFYIQNQVELLKNFEKTNDIYGNPSNTSIIKDLNKQFFIPNMYNLKERFINYKLIDMYGLSLREDFIKNEESDFLLFGNYTRINKNKDIKDINPNDIKLNSLHVFLVSDISGDKVTLVCPEEEKNGGTFIMETSLRRIEWAFETENKKSAIGYSIISKEKL